MPLQTSMPPPVPLSLVPNEQSQPPLRSPYTYVGSATTPSHVSSNTTPPASSDGLNVPRYVDNARPAKAPRTSGHQSVPSASSITNTEASPEYRYATYAGVGSNQSDVSPSNYPPDASGPTSAPTRDYYPPSGAWTTSAGEHNPSVGYTSGGDARGYSYGHDQYKPSATGPAAAKPDPNQPGAPVYGSTPRGSFDNMNNYSWSGH